MRRRPILFAAALLTGASVVTIAAVAQGNRSTGYLPSAPYPSETQPFTATPVAEFQDPWAIGFLPDNRLLVTEIEGRLFLLTPDGERTEVTNLPPVAAGGQVGLHDVAASPDYAQTGRIYLSYSAPSENGTQITLAHAVLRQGDGTAQLADLTEIFRQPQQSWGGHPGAIIAFDPAGDHVFLTLGERQEEQHAQDPDMARGKIIRLLLDGSVPEDNPWASEGGFRAQTWTTGHRNPYGLAFDADGVLWEHEMGPRGGDEVNRIEPGLNYGWGEVSEGVGYDFAAIPHHDTNPDFTPPEHAWGTGTAPSGLAFYQGEDFPDWQGSALVGALAGQALIRLSFEGGQPAEAERWDMGARIRDVDVAPDGTVWVLEDGAPDRLLRLDF